MSAAAMWMAILLGSSVSGAPSGTPQVTVQVPRARGPVGPSLVRRVVRSHLGTFTRCYRQGAFKRAAKRGGRLALDVGIARSGRVRFARVQSNTLRHRVTEGCVLAGVRRIVFPKATRSSRATVSLTFRVLAVVRATLTMGSWEAGRGIDVGMMRRVLRSRHGQFLTCFRTHVRTRPGRVIGTVKLRLRVFPNGHARGVSAKGGTLNLPATRRCIERLVRILRFSKPPRRPVWIGAELRFRKH